MGSGSSGLYSGGSAQPFAPEYHVVSKMKEQDKQDSNIYNSTKGYFKNPLASTIQDSIEDGRVRMNGHLANGTYTYVLDTNGNIIFGKRYNPNNSHSRAPHPTLIGGKDPVVQCAGMISLKKGRITWYNNDSGHFRPNEKSLTYVETAMKKIQAQYPTAFDKKYSGGKKR